MLRLVTSLPSTLDNVEAGTVIDPAVDDHLHGAVGADAIHLPRRAPSTVTSALPFAATADASSFADASPAAPSIRTHTRTGKP